MAAECKAAKLDGFPMWIINGKRYAGEQRFSQLEAALQKKWPYPTTAWMKAGVELSGIVRFKA